MADPATPEWTLTFGQLKNYPGLGLIADQLEQLADLHDVGGQYSTVVADTARSLNWSLHAYLDLVESDERPGEPNNSWDATLHAAIKGASNAAQTLANIDRQNEGRSSDQLRAAAKLIRLETVKRQPTGVPDVPNNGITPVPLKQNQQELVDTIRDAGRRLTTREILNALSAKQLPASEGNTKNTLAILVQFRFLTTGTDAFGKGYGLPAWSTTES